MVDKKALIDLYRGRGTWTSLYTRIKFKICPLLPVEPFLPKRGRVLDLGCGNGLFAAILKLGSEERRITGLDLDEGKIAVAREVFRAWPEDAFAVGDVVSAAYPAADIVTIVDVLYLIPHAAQEEILRKSHAALPRGGLLALKEMDTRPRWKYLWNAFQETLAVKIIGFTLGGRFYFKSRAEMTALLERIGFEVETVRLDKGYGYPHILYIARKK
jgi:predicted TPR repeat methyltransferase